MAQDNSLKKYLLCSVVFYMIAYYLAKYIPSYSIQVIFLAIVAKLFVASSVAAFVTVFLFTRDHSRVLTKRERRKMAGVSAIILFVIGSVLLLSKQHGRMNLSLLIVMIPEIILNFVFLNVLYKWFGNLFLRFNENLGSDICNEKRGVLGKIFFTPSISLLLFAGILCVLQITPYTGVFLMMSGAPVLVAYLISFGFIAMVIEVVFKKLPIWTVIFPIVYFGGYWIYVLPSHFEFRKILATINKDINIPFNPDDHSLVFDDSSTARSFLTQFEIPVIYESSHLERSIRIAGSDICSKNQKSQAYKKAQIQLRYKFIGMQKICLVSMLEKPILPVLTVSESIHFDGKDHLTSVNTSKIYTITEPNGKEYKIIVPKRRLHNVFPLPYFKCTLVKMNTDWGCGYGFMRGGGYNLLAVEKMDFLGEALGLEKKPEEKVYKSDYISSELEMKIQARLNQ